MFAFFKSLIQRLKKNNKIINSSLVDLRKRVKVNESSVDQLNSTISSMSKLSSFSICDYAVDLLANQLTLIEWVFWKKKQPALIRLFKLIFDSF